MKPLLYALLGLLGIGPANVLSTSPDKTPMDRLATLDLKGGPCALDPLKDAPTCKQKRSAAPVLADLLRSRTVYPDGTRYDKLYLQRQGARDSVWSADSYNDGGPHGVQILKLEFKPGRDGWLEIQTLEHALPRKGAEAFRPGPPFLTRYVYEKDQYVRRAP